MLRLSALVGGVSLCVFLSFATAVGADEPKAPTKKAPSAKSAVRQPTVVPADDESEVAAKPDPVKDEEYYELYRVFAETFAQVEQNYVKEVDRRKLMEAAIRGVLNELDPYSNFISPDEIDR